MARKATTKTIDFEKSLKKLEQLVNKLEKGELSLEDSLKHFEEGIRLTRDCQTALQKAEQKISVLSKQDEEWKETPIDKEKMLEDD